MQAKLQRLRAEAVLCTVKRITQGRVFPTTRPSFCRQHYCPGIDQHLMNQQPIASAFHPRHGRQQLYSVCSAYC